MKPTTKNPKTKTEINRTIKNLFVCVNPSVGVSIWTLRYYRKASIKYLCEEHTGMSWEKLKKYGWRCVRVSVTFKNE